MATYALSWHKQAHLIYDICQSCALDIIMDAQKVNDPLHLKSTQYLRKVKNRYDDILWEMGRGYCDGIGKKCECSMDSKVDCSILRDIMCA
jgi:hypothetical protein